MNLNVVLKLFTQWNEYLPSFSQFESLSLSQPNLQTRHQPWLVTDVRGHSVPHPAPPAAQIVTC